MANAKSIIRDIQLNTTLNLASNRAVVTDFIGMNKNTGAWYNYALSPLWRSAYTASSTISIGDDTYKTKDNVLYKNDVFLKDYSGFLKVNSSIIDGEYVAMSANCTVKSINASLTAVSKTGVSIVIATNYFNIGNVWIWDYKDYSVVFYSNSVAVWNGTAWSIATFSSKKAAFFYNNDIQIITDANIISGAVEIHYRNVSGTTGTLTSGSVQYLIEGQVQFAVNGTLSLVQGPKGVYATVDTITALQDRSFNNSFERKDTVYFFINENGLTRSTITTHNANTAASGEPCTLMAKNLDGYSIYGDRSSWKTMVSIDSDRWLHYRLFSIAPYIMYNGSYYGGVQTMYQSNLNSYLFLSQNNYTTGYNGYGDSRVLATIDDSDPGELRGLLNYSNNLEFCFTDVGKFRLFYRNDSIIAIAYNNQLLTEWYDIDENKITLGDDYLYYYSVNGKKWVYVNISASNELTIKNLADRIIVNVVAENNAYNGKEFYTFSRAYVPLYIGWKRPLNWVYYNGTDKVSGYYIDTFLNRLLYPKGTIYASFGRGTGYANTGDTDNVGPIWASIYWKYSKGRNDNFTLLDNLYDTSSPGSVYRSYLTDIDVYASQTNSVLTYQYTLTTNSAGVTTKTIASLVNTEKSATEPDYINLPVAIDVMKYIDTYSSVKYVSIAGSAYQLMIYNNLPLLLTQILATTEGVEAFFVLQGQNYAVINGYIDIIEYSNGQIVNQTPITSVANMKFLGNTDRVAYFYAPMNKTIRTFTADNTLNTLYEATTFDEAIESYFDLQTDSIFVTLKDKSIVVTPGNMFEIDTPSKQFSFGTNNFNDGSYAYSYYKQANYEKQKLKLETQWYGLTAPRINMIVDCIYIELWDDEMSKGEFEISMDSLVNYTRTTNTKKFYVSQKDWDKDTNTVYLRYQPGIQLASAFKLNISSDFAIKRLAVSYKEDVPTIAKNNI